MDNENNSAFIPVGFFGVKEPMAFLFTCGLYGSHINLCLGRLDHTTREAHERGGKHGGWGMRLHVNTTSQSCLWAPLAWRDSFLLTPGRDGANAIVLLPQAMRTEFLELTTQGEAAWTKLKSSLWSRHEHVCSWTLKENNVKSRWTHHTTIQRRLLQAFRSAPTAKESSDLET